MRPESNTFDKNGGFDWPDWVPLEVREQIAAFWGCFGRTAQDWVAAWSAPYDRHPPLGERVTMWGLGGRRETGRYVPAWNNIGRVVRDDGSFAYVSTKRVSDSDPDCAQCGKVTFAPAIRWGKPFCGERCQNAHACAALDALSASPSPEPEVTRGE